MQELQERNEALAGLVDEAQVTHCHTCSGRLDQHLLSFLQEEVKILKELSALEYCTSGHFVFSHLLFFLCPQSSQQ